MKMKLLRKMHIMLFCGGRWAEKWGERLLYKWKTSLFFKVIEINVLFMKCSLSTWLYECVYCVVKHPWWQAPSCVIRVCDSSNWERLWVKCSISRFSHAFRAALTDFSVRLPPPHKHQPRHDPSVSAKYNNGNGCVPITLYSLIFTWHEVCLQDLMRIQQVDAPK